MTVTASRLKQLIAVAREESSDKRRDLLREITDVFMAQPDRYTSSELQHFDVILSRVAEQVEVELRRELAAKLADEPSAPKNLIRKLAHDEISVAEPVLRRSPVLSADDLLRVARQRSQAHLNAIANRADVPEAVTDELVERGDEKVLVSLAANKSARLRPEAMEKMVDHSRTMKSLQKPMAERIDVPPKLLTQMYFFVSSALKKEILKRSENLDPTIIDDAVKTNRKRILTDVVRNVQDEVAIARRFVAERAAANAINENLLKDLLESKKATEFLLAFAHHIGVDPSTAQAIMKDRTWESLAIAARAAGLERSTFAKIVFSAQRGDAEQTKALRIMDLYPKIPQDAAERVMRFWRIRTQATKKSEAAAPPANALTQAAG